METLFICGQADLSRDESTILVSTNGAKRRIPVENVRHIVVTGDGTLTTKFLGLAGRKGIRVSLFDHYGWYCGSFEPASHIGAGEVVIRQAAMIMDGSRRMVVAREFVRAAMDNMIGNLRYYAYRGNQALKRPIDELRSLQECLPKAASVEALMGHEGLGKRTYYGAWGLIDPRLAFAPRVKRPPNNRVNCLLSFLNGLAYAAVRHEIAKCHLDEKLAFLHAPSAQRSSLSLDLSEPFKPIVADRQIFAMVRKGMISDGWFAEEPGVCMLTEHGRRAVVERFAAAVDAPVGSRSIRDAIRAEALKLQRHVLGMDDYVGYRAGGSPCS